MIAIAKVSPETKSRSNWQTGFLAMMPDIDRYARRAFHYLDTEARAEAVQEVVVSSMAAYVRLYQREKVDLAYPSVLARFAIAQYRDGRRVSEKMNCQDVLSPYAHPSRWSRRLLPATSAEQCLFPSLGRFLLRSKKPAVLRLFGSPGTRVEVRHQMDFANCRFLRRS